MKNITARNIDGGYEEINEKNIRNTITTNREISSFNLIFFNTKYSIDEKTDTCNADSENKCVIPFIL